MTLIDCPACGARISPNARACPRCGEPVQNDGPTVTIQETAKGLKLQSLLSALLVIAGLLLAMLAAGEPGESPGLGLAMMGVGFVWFVVVRALTWWRHE